MLLSYEAKDKEEEAFFTREKLTQLETVTAGFRGQSIREKIEEEMVYQQNPLQRIDWKEFDDVNKLHKMIERMELDVKEINEVKKELLEKTKRQIKKLSQIRDDIENLGTNRYNQDFGIEYEPEY